VAFGIGQNLRTDIPRSELGPAMGSFPPGLTFRLAGPPAFGIGLNRRAAAAPAPMGYLTAAAMPTDVPAPARPPRDRADAQRQVAEGEALAAGIAPAPPFDLVDLVRGVIGLARNIGTITRNPGLVTAAQLIGRVIPAPASPIPISGPLEVMAGERAAALPTERAAAADVYGLEISRGVADVESGIGSVEVVGGGTRDFSFETGFDREDRTADGSPADGGVQEAGFGSERGEKI